MSGQSKGSLEQKIAFIGLNEDNCLKGFRVIAVLYLDIVVLLVLLDHLCTRPNALGRMSDLHRQFGDFG